MPRISEMNKKPSSVIVMTKDEWIAKGTELFGPDMLQWRFVCPACKHVQKVADLAPYKDQGATPDSATHNCIGRYDGHMNVDMGAGQPCNYTGYGLFNFCPILVKDGDKEIRCFAFDEGAKLPI